MTIAPGAPLSDPPAPLRLAEPALAFGARAARLAELASRAGGDPFLAFLGRLAAAQRAALRAVPGHLPPRGPGLPLDAAALADDLALPAVVAALVAAVPEDGLPAPAAAALAGLADASPAAIARLARAVLDGTVPPAQLAAAPFVGAALQALAAARAARLDPASIARTERGCPVCGSAPVAGTVGGDDRLRYLACALCGAEWHLARLHCASCRETRGLGYHHLEHDPGARAEACERCGTYVKLFDLAQRPGADPVADDAATLALDVLLGEAGFARAGQNLLSPAAPPSDAGP